MTITLNLTYYPDITQGVDQSIVRENIIQFSDSLSTQLTSDLGVSVKITVDQVLSVPQQYQKILGGHSHIALMKPVAYVLAHQKNSNILPAVVALRPINGQVGRFYYTQIYARSDLGIASLDDVKNIKKSKLKITYGDRFSTSNFLMAAYLLKTQGIHPFLSFKEIIFSGGHDNSIELVYNGQCDIGAGHDGVIKILSEKNIDAETKIVSLGRMNIHSDPVVVNTQILPPQMNLSDISNALVKISNLPSVMKNLDVFWGWVKGLETTAHEDHINIEIALRDMGLSEEDMLNE